jgi:hypothetical protein
VSNNQLQRKPETAVLVQKGAIEGTAGYLTGAVLTGLSFLLGSLITWLKGLPFQTGLFISLALSAVLVWVFDRLSRIWHRHTTKSPPVGESTQLIQEGEREIPAAWVEASPAYAALQEKYVDVVGQLAGKKQQLKEESRKLLDMTGQKDAVYTALNESRAMIGQLEQELRELQSREDEYGSVLPVLKEQAQHLSSLVIVEKIVIVAHRLLSDSDYIKFKFKIKNYSVYSISIEKPRGSLTYNSEPFEALPVLMVDIVRDLQFWQSGSFTMKQSLTRRETLSILNTPAAFAFGEARMPIETTPAIAHEQDLHVGFTVERDALLQAYPKLDMVILSAELKGYQDLTENRLFDLPEHLGSVINIHVQFENPRQSAIEIKQYKLTTHENAGTSRTTAAQAGEIRQNPAQGVSGEAQGLALPNLNDLRICAEQREPYEGWLQFIVKTHPQNLRGGVADLSIIDVRGEEHPVKTPALQYEVDEKFRSLRYE